MVIIILPRDPMNRDLSLGAKCLPFCGPEGGRGRGRGRGREKGKEETECTLLQTQVVFYTFYHRTEYFILYIHFVFVSNYMQYIVLMLLFYFLCA